MSKTTISKSPARTKLISPLVVATAVICLFVILLASFVVYQKLQQKDSIATYPLGDSHKLEYIGETGYGCLLICDANPAKVYYYATTMSPQQVAAYFKNAKLDNPEDLQTQNNPSTPLTLTLKLPGNAGFYVTYYSKGEEQTKGTPMQSKAADRHVITLLAEQYDNAKKAIQ